MKFLIDENLPPRMARWLTARGHTAEHVLDCGLAGAPDADIWRAARAMTAVVVTRDDDSAPWLWVMRQGRS